MSTTKPKARRTPYVDKNGRRVAGVYFRINADSTRTFEIGWRDASGKQKWETVRNGGGVTASKALLALKHADRENRVPEPDNKRLTFNQAADLWWSVRASGQRPNTQSAYEHGLKHLRPYFGSRKLADVSVTTVSEYLIHKQSGPLGPEEKRLGGWTLRGHLTVLSAVFTYSGRHLGYRGINPVSLLDSVERPSIEDEKPKRVLAPDELERLLNCIDKNYRTLFDLATETGGRLGEVLGLVWADINLDGEAVHFTHQLDRKGNRQELKTTRSRRWVEITTPMTTKLRTLKLASTRSRPHDLVFVTRNGTGHDHRNVGGRVLARAVKASGLEAVTKGDVILSSAPTFHSLRHTHGSSLIASGWDLEEVSARLGHSNVAITARTYVHAYDAARRSADRRGRLPAIHGADVVADAVAQDGNESQQTANVERSNVSELRKAQ